MFIEHVAAEAGSALRRWQRRLRRPWGLVADGCRPDQDTVGLLREAGFDVSDLELDRTLAPARTQLLESPALVPGFSHSDRETLGKECKDIKDGALAAAVGTKEDRERCEVSQIQLAKGTVVPHLEALDQRHAR